MQFMMLRKSDERIILGFCMLVLLVLLTSCGHPRVSTQPTRKPAPSTKSPAKTKPYKVMGKWYHPVADTSGFHQRGTASWYGKAFHGKKTANGEIYNMNAMTAAHKTLPLGTWVHVRNLDNGKEVDVRINDRGPFSKKRIIDLSYAAAKKLGLIHHGTAKVEVTVLKKKTTKASAKDVSPKSSGRYTLQVGSFETRTNAEKLMKSLSKKHSPVNLVAEEGCFKVRVGLFDSRKAAEKIKNQLIRQGYSAFMVTN